MAAGPSSGTTGASGPTESSSGLPRWLWVAIALAGLAAVIVLVRLLPFGTAILSDVHRRNSQDLEIVATRLESWTGAIDGVARGHFIRGRVEAIDPDERDWRDGWRQRARLRHPELRDYRVIYRAVPEGKEGADPCAALVDNVRRREGALPFVRSYLAGGGTMLKVLGRFDVADIWALDMRTDMATAGRPIGDADPQPTVDAFLTNIQNGASPDPGARVVCYGAVIPLERMLGLPDTGRAFASVLIADPKGRILAQLGRETLPIQSLDVLKPAPPPDPNMLVKALAKAAAPGTDTTAWDKAMPAPAANPSDLKQNLAPVELTVGDRSFIAYVRPFAPPATGFPACSLDTPAAGTEKAGTAAATGDSKLPEGAQAAAAPRTALCYVVALVPQEGLWRQVFNPPPGPILALALALGVLLLLLPALRLMLLGPADAISRPELAVLVLGLPAAASLATLAFLVATDVAAWRATAKTRAESIAQTAATQIATDLADRVTIAAARAQQMRQQTQTAMGAELRAVEHDAICARRADETPAQARQLQAGWCSGGPPQADAKSARPPVFGGCVRASVNAEFKREPRRRGDDGLPPYLYLLGDILPVDPRPLPCSSEASMCGILPGKPALPALELTGLRDADGRPLPNVRTLSCRGFAGGRTDVGGRPYFQRLTAGHDSLADGTTGGETGGHPYVVAHVKALQDGLPQTVVAARVDAPTWYVPRDPGRPHVYAVATTTLPALVHPVLPAPYQFILVDTHDPRLPVLVHSDSTRAGAERLAASFANGDEVHARLARQVQQARSGGAPEVSGFRRFYAGKERHFAATAVPGTSWALLVAYPLDAVDAVPVGTGWRTLTAWASTSIPFGLLWLAWLRFVGRDGRRAKTGDAPKPSAHDTATPWLQRVASVARTSIRLFTQRPFSLGATGWSRLWPQQGHSRTYADLAPGLALLGALVLALVALLGALGVDPVWAVATGLLLARLVAGLWLHLALAARPATVEPLSPGAQRRYGWLAAALMLCLSVVPMAGLWTDARAFTSDRHRADLLGTARADIEAGRRAMRDLLWTLGLTARYQPDASPQGLFGFTPGETREPGDARTRNSYAGSLYSLQSGVSLPALQSCAPGEAGEPRLCGKGNRGIGYAPPTFLTSRVGWAPFTSLAILAAGLALLIAFFVRRTLKALCGFGIALEAVAYPRLDLWPLWPEPAPLTPERLTWDQRLAAKGADELQTLNHKSILVNPPWSLVPMLKQLNAANNGSRKLRLLDLASLISAATKDAAAVATSGQMPPTAPGGSAPDDDFKTVARGDILVVSGFELLLADPVRRQGALQLLERLSAAIDNSVTGDSTTDPHLLFMTPVAPMDRILDAYEREKRASGDDAPDAFRENLRWGRLFEDFATFQFRPIELTDGPLLEKELPGLKVADERDAIDTVLRELRWLKPDVVNGCINEEVTDLAKSPELKSQLAKGLVPLNNADDRSPYPALYREQILKWAKARRFAGPQAALTHLKGQMIEHYQMLWSASTRAERLVLNNLAKGRFVNIATTVAFGSLVRRGLVVLDPDPRLMNESFAMFVRQSEKLETIKDLQKSVGTGAWAKAQTPVLLGIGLAGALLAALLAFGEDSLRFLLPVLAAGVPVLASTLLKTQR